MADQLFHRRRAKRADALRREAQKREPYDVVLIVCEGARQNRNICRNFVMPSS